MNPIEKAGGIQERVARLLTGMDRDQWGDVGPSVYETARVVALAPWLPGHGTRMNYLLQAQGQDGSWGAGPGVHRRIPTLSVVAAILTALGRDEGPRDQLADAAGRGLAVLCSSQLAGVQPDTAAAELIVPSLVADINRQLDEVRMADLPGLAEWPRGRRVVIPSGDGREVWIPTREALVTGGRFPSKLYHTFEAIAEYCPERALPVPTGLLGSSPAATAAWISCAPASAARRRAVEDLIAVGHRYGGLFPEAAPITVIERLWVLAAILRIDIPSAVRGIAQQWISDIYHSEGVHGAPGLPVDADDTAVALHVAAELGLPHDAAVLNVFENVSHFTCYLGEDTPSVSTNAHVLQALTSTGHADQRRAVKVKSWLLDQQTPEGYWTDKWHASPYYATAQCVHALAADPDSRARRAITRAVQWVRGSRRQDGRWGIWSGTAEESAYAVQILLHDQNPQGDTVTPDILDYEPSRPHPALWYDKTLYAPYAVIEAELAITSEQLAAHIRQGHAHVEDQH